MKESEESLEPMGVSANVIKSGNRILEIKVHCVVRDNNGQLQWEQDATGRLIVPANFTPQGFVAEGPIETRVVPKGEW